ncbi:MAG: NYN domain-containing protein [Acidobacteria bacterium]|nr:MAG: NYN domain-containing protein [Acidobacteriota bacterium]
MEQLAELRDGSRPGPEESGPPAGRREDKPRVGVFVDVQNMFYGAREKNARLDFEALLEAATAGRRLVRAVAYLVEAPDINQSAFIHLLETKAYEVKRKPLKIRPDRSMKGNWDLEMALDALTTARHLDVVVLVTGDGDFVPLVRALKLQGKRVEVYGFRRSTAPDLRQAADRFHQITRRLLRPLEPARAARRARARAAAPAAAAESSTVSSPAQPGAAPASS